MKLKQDLINLLDNLAYGVVINKKPMRYCSDNEVYLLTVDDLQRLKQFVINTSESKLYISKNVDVEKFIVSLIKSSKLFN